MFSSSVTLAAALLLSACIVHLCVSQPYIYNPPKQQAHLVGDRGWMYCSLDIPDDDVMEWRAYIGDDVTGKRIYDSQSETVTDDRYDVKKTGSTFGLEFKVVTKDIVGDYECGLVNAEEAKNATLVALEEMTCNASPPVVMENSDVTLFSEVYYYGAIHSKTFAVQLQFLDLPDFRRRKDMEQVFHNERITGSVTINASRHDNGMEFPGKLALFPQPNGIDPAYEKTCRVGYSVLYAPDVPNFARTSHNDKLFVGDEVTCNADAKPEATYTWTVSGEDDPISGPKLVITRNMFTDMNKVNMSCTATNEHGSSTSDVSLSADPYASMAAMTVTSSLTLILSILLALIQ